MELKEPSVIRNDERISNVISRLNVQEEDIKKINISLAATDADVKVLKTEVDGLGNLIEAKNRAQTLELKSLITLALKEHQDDSDNAKIKSLSDERTWFIRAIIGAIIAVAIGITVAIFK